MDANVKNLSLNYTAKVEPVEKLNEQFLLCKIWVHALGKNRNFSHFSKENVLRNISSLNYIPVVGHLIETEDGKKYIGGHDMTIAIENDKLIIKSLTVPYGVVMNDTWEFEDVVESDGTTVTYIVAKAILWIARYPELMEAIYSEDVYFAQSMEINFSKYEPLKEDKNYIDIIDWVYSALCLLGKSDDPEYNTIPCFPSARVEPYSNNFNQSEFSEVMSELKEQLSFYFNKQSDKEGGKSILNEELRSTILKEFNLSLEDIDFEITDDMTEEAFRLKLEEFTNNKNGEPDNNQPTESVLFSATYRQKREALQNALEGSLVRDADGNVIEETSYWVADFDDEYVYVEKYHWTQNDSDCTYGRFTYTFEETNITATITGEFEEMVLVWLTKEENQQIQEERGNYEVLKTEFENYKKDYSTPNSEVEELQTFKQKRLDDDRENEETELFSKFEDELSSMEEYKTIKEHAKDFSIEALEDKLYALLGKKNAKFSIKKKDNASIKIPVDMQDDSNNEDPYGGLHARYGKKPINN